MEIGALSPAAGRLGALTAGLTVLALALTACGPVSIGTATPSTTSSSASPSSTSSSPTATTGAVPASSNPAPSNPAPSSPAPPTTGSAAPPAPLLSSGAAGDKVRELQSRLQQLQWFDGDITGTYGETTAAAVRGFQDKRGMPATGSLDQATWDAVLSKTRQPTDDELHNRLTPGPALLKQGATGAQVRDLQGRLKQIGWWSGDVLDTFGPLTVEAVKGFQAKRALPVTGEVDQRTLDRLRGMTRTPTADELANVKPKPAPVPATGLDPRCLTGRAICVSKARRELVWVIDGVPQLRLDVRFGSENNPTREGSFTVYQKNRDWTSTLYGSKMPYSMFFSGGEAIHYSADFAARGYSGASHGCVNTRDLGGVASLFEQVSLGDKVIVYP